MFRVQSRAAPSTHRTRVRNGFQEYPLTGADACDVARRAREKCSATRSDQTPYLVVEHLRVLTSALAGVPQQRDQTPEPELVVILFAELLPAQQEQHVHLVGQVPGVPETLAEQHYFRDQLGVRHHHGYGAEQRLQVVRQLRPARVPGVHRDEYAARGHQVDAVAVEHELPQAARERRVYGQYLLRHHRQHLDVDPVELVEAAPSALLSQPCCGCRRPPRGTAHVLQTSAPDTRVLGYCHLPPPPPGCPGLAGTTRLDPGTRYRFAYSSFTWPTGYTVVSNKKIRTQNDERPPDDDLLIICVAIRIKGDDYNHRSQWRI